MNPTDTLAPVDAPEPPDSVVADPAAPSSPDAVAATPTAPADPEPPETVVADPGDVAAPPPHQAAPAQPTKITLLEGMKVLFDEKVGLAPVQVVDKEQPVKGQYPENGQLH